jgi:hypothetical protein
MRNHSSIRWTALALGTAGLLAFASHSQANGTVTLKAVMIHASNQPAALDRRIENIEYKLRRVFKFKHYKHVGKGNITLSLPGKGTIALGSGYSLEVEASPAGKGRVRTRVHWRKGGSTLLRTSTVVSRSVPTVLGGASHGSGKMIVTLVVE